MFEVRFKTINGINMLIYNPGELCWDYYVSNTTLFNSYKRRKKQGEVAKVQQEIYDLLTLTNNPGDLAFVIEKYDYVKQQRKYYRNL